jgi:hypothetical protein
MGQALPHPKHLSPLAHPTTHNRAGWKLKLMARLVCLQIWNFGSFAGVGINLLTVRLGQFGEVFAW